MEIVTVLWSFFAAVAIILAIGCGLVWLMEAKDLARLMLCILGIAAAASAYFELALMGAETPAEYGEYLRWLHPPVFLALVAQVLFVHIYLGTGRAWLMWTVLSLRFIILVLNFSVRPTFSYSEIISLKQVSIFGDQVTVIGSAHTRPWQWLAVASLVLLTAYLFDAAIQQWRKGGRDARRKALVVGVGILVPMVCTSVYGQLLAWGVLLVPVSNVPWFLGALITTGYEVGREVMVGRRSQLALAEMQIKLAHLDRVSVLGQLASTLAHELAQPLASTAVNVRVALEHLKRDKPDLKELREILEDIGRDDGRATQIIDHMRQFSRRRSIEMQPVQLDDVVQDVIALVRRAAVAKGVALRVSIPPGLPRVSADRVHLSQVLLNLLTNSLHAVEACPSGRRTIAVEARRDCSNERVELAVRDSGPGIPDGMKDKIFAPFFTTKPHGMGIGLNLSRTIIEAHGGSLWADYAGDGAVFRFTLRNAPHSESSVQDRGRPLPAAVSLRAAGAA